MRDCRPGLVRVIPAAVQRFIRSRGNPAGKARGTAARSRAMAIERYESFSPAIPPSAFVAASADVIGRVTLGEESSIWYHTTLRGDINEIVIGPRSNVQDNAVIHLADDYGCYVGELVTVGHSAILHACTVKDEVLVGMGAIVLDGAVIGERSIIGAGALVTGGTVIPPGSLVLGSPAKVVRTLSPDEQSKVKVWAQKYVEQSRKFLARD
jgi:carbonic anhydrase/acetyltransferase-like protein (isoleucine patch superfamily)